jgi:hypothetical protein
MLRKSTLFLVFIILVVSSVVPSAAQESSVPRFEWADILNVAIPYASAENGTIQLNNGYARQRVGSPYIASTDFILSDKHAFGDVDSDGLEDVVAILFVDPPGPIQFNYLLTILNDNGEPNVLPLLRLGDREPVHFISIVPGEVGIRNRTHGEGDPLCCATLETAQRFIYTRGALRLVEQFVLYRQADVSPDVPADILDYGILSGTAFEPITVQSEHDSLSISFDGRIGYGEVEYFRFLGRSGQHLSIRLWSPNQNVSFALYEPEFKRTLFSGNTQFDATGISGTLTSIRPYIIRVVSTTVSDTDFRLSLLLTTFAP